MTHTSDCAKAAFLELCVRTDSPYSLAAKLLLDSGDKAFLTSLKRPDPRHYLLVNRFRADYLVYNYLRKYKGLKTGIDKKEVAFAKWRIAEEQCAKSNALIDSGSYLSYEVESAILRARLKIARLLGEFDYAKVLGKCGMGPGATFDLRRKAAPGTKYSLPISVTGTCSSLAKAWLEQDMHWAFAGSDILPDGPYSLLPCNFIVVKGNRVSTAPKDASEDRVTCIEPTANLFFQKGVGSYFRHSLRRIGIDLDDQSRNQRLARIAYALGLATLDLSSASDTVCIAIVKLLLPSDWWIYLDRIRCQHSLMNNQWIKTSKWSSMGNGFTFELETLIFWALAPEGVTTLAVYGDDIVCDQGSASEYIKILEGLGFTINKTKSFVDGVFFESCGEHFFEGHEVTPVYQKEEISNALSFVRAYNRLFRFNDRTNVGGCHSPTAFAMSLIRKAYPYSVLPSILHTADDRGFHTYRDPSWVYDPNRGYRCRILKVPRFNIKVHQDGLYAQKLQDPFSDAWLNPYGRRAVQDLESKARPSYAWVQPYTLKSEWLPRHRRDSVVSDVSVETS